MQIGMPVSGRIAALGRVTQLAYVPRDFDSAVQFWSRRLGVGPFFYLDRAIVDELTAHELPLELDYSIAFSYWGDVQIELIRQNDRVSSIFRDWNSNSIHHLQIAVDDYQNARSICADHGLSPEMEGRGIPGMADFRFGFFGLGEGAPAGYLELAYFPDNVLLQAVAGRAKEHVRSWDGADALWPIERL